MENQKETKNTTIKISKRTKLRLDSLKEYRRESYEEILEKIMDLLNLCKANPIKSREKLIKMDLQHKEYIEKIRYNN